MNAGRALALVAVSAVLGLLGPHATQRAGAEVVQRGGVRVSIVGSIRPTSLPRSGEAPLALSVAGRIAAALPGTLPKLETIAIAINSRGRVRNRDIPVCRIGRIDPSTSTEAMAACGSSLVGEGHFSADLRLPEQSPFPSHGKILVFNGRLGGRPALLAHIYGTAPVPTSYVLPFVISAARRGTFGTVLEASLPEATGEWGYVTGIGLSLQSRFLSAACPAPAGFPGAVFPLLRARFGFAGGLGLGVGLTRSCTVRG